jgi:hypothetical protein
MFSFFAVFLPTVLIYQVDLVVVGAGSRWSNLSQQAGHIRIRVVDNPS